MYTTPEGEGGAGCGPKCGSVRGEPAVEVLSRTRDSAGVRAHCDAGGEKKKPKKKKNEDTFQLTDGQTTKGRYARRAHARDAPFRGMTCFCSSKKRGAWAKVMSVKPGCERDRMGSGLGCSGVVDGGRFETAFSEPEVNVEASADRMADERP